VNAIDRLCTIATDVSLEATTLAADVRDELANMRSAIGKALADMKDVDEPCDGGSWCFVHDDHVPIDSEHCHTHQGHLRLQALVSSALPSPSVERVQAPAAERLTDYRNMTKLLTPTEVAELLDVPANTLPMWRYRGGGPRFVKVGRHVRYRPEDVDAWLDAHTRGGADAVA
jgi:excisionase family DNA binding protein